MAPSGGDDTEPAGFPPEHRRMIAGQARTLAERLAEPETVTVGERDTDHVTTVMEEWADQFADEASFERRLEQAGVTREACRDLVAADRLVSDEPIPEWVDELERVIRAVLARDPPDVDADDRPFPEFLAAIADHARDRLDDSAAATLSAAGVDTMADWLQQRLADQSLRALFVEFKTFIAARDRSLAFTEPEEIDGDPPTEQYEAFVDHLFDGGVVGLFQEYPMLGRLTVTRIEQWVSHLEEFARRLDADRAALADRFDATAETVAELEPLADDTHGDGRAVMRVTFESGFTVAYKPRSVDAGEQFYATLDRLDDHLATPSFDTPTYLARDGYGWMEWLEYAECPDEAAVERYYERAGALLCLAYLMEFTDCQYENLLSVGEHPMLVDAETVMTPYVATDRQPVQQGQIGWLNQDSVLLTALVPWGITGIGSGGRDPAATAGFGVASGTAEMIEDATLPALDSETINTDLMSVDERPVSAARETNVPRVDGEDCPPGESLDALLDGFRDAYRTILDLRDDGRLESVLRLSAFEGIETRYIYRATMTYKGVTMSLFSRDCLADGARFGAEIDRLTAGYAAQTTERRQHWAVYEAECGPLSRLDPPRFTTRADETTLRLDGEPIGFAADTAGLDRCRERIAAADEADLAEQVELLRGCFGRSPDPSPPTNPGHGAATDDRLRTEAERLVETVDASGSDHRWASLAPSNEHERLTVHLGLSSLYVGQLGIAMLPAAAYRLTGEDRHREMAYAAIEPFRSSPIATETLPHASEHGGVLGVGSLTYGYAALGSLLDDEALHEEARRIGTSVTDQMVAEDDLHDVIGGSAGTILGLLGAYDRTGDPELLSAATTCGDHLRATQTEVGGWETIDAAGVAEQLGGEVGVEAPLYGFAHGASGIAYALYRLADTADTPRHRETARAAQQYVTDDYQPEVGNWQDHRCWTDTDTVDRWCYGRSSVGLASLGASAYTDDDAVSRAVDYALDSAPTDHVSGTDHLCCGNAGRAEFFLSAAERLGRRTGDARALLGGTIDRAETTGSYRTLDRATRVRNPTLFRGLAGIGYTMLRVVAPDQLPNLLLWE